jgi:hypothetical protein
MKYMTAGELKAALDGVPDDVSVQLHVTYKTDNGNTAARMETASEARVVTHGDMSWFHLYGCVYCNEMAARVPSA